MSDRFSAMASETRVHVKPGNGFHPNNSYGKVDSFTITDGVSYWYVDPDDIYECLNPKNCECRKGEK